MKHFDVHPLFNMPIALTNISLSENEQNDILEFVKLQTWEKANQALDSMSDTNKSLQSEDLYILEKNELFFLKNKIIDAFSDYKNNVMRYENTDFKITTSWLTKTEYGQKSNYHNHGNCMFSAVFYINQSDNSESGNIVFTKYENKRFNIKPVEHNLFNSETWTFNPQKHDLIIFPSETYHRVKTHLLKENRYSLALNFMPVGHIGVYDSILELKC